MISKRFINQVTLIYVISVPAVALFTYLLISPAGPESLSPAVATKLKEPPEKALSLATDMIKHVTTLSTGLIAVGIWLLKRPLIDDSELRQRLMLVSAAILALSSSLYFGFVALDGALAMVSFGAFDAQSDIVWAPQSFQYYSFITGALILGLACIRCLNAIRDAE